MAEIIMTGEILKKQFNNLVQQTIKVEEGSVKSSDFFQDNDAAVRKS